MSLNDSSVVRFVIPTGQTELTVSDALASAYQQFQENGAGQQGEWPEPIWVSEEEVLNLSPTKTVNLIQGDLVSRPPLPTVGFKKSISTQDVFVMDPFSGPAFDHVTNSNKYKCTVIGPRYKQQSRSRAG